MRRFGVLAAMLVLALSACSNDGQPTGSPTTAAVEPTATPTTSAPATPTPIASSAAADPESLFLAMLLLGGDAYGSATDEQLISAGRKACEVLDAGSGLDLAAAFTVLELPDDVTNEGHWAVAMTATMSLCPEHKGLVEEIAG